MIALFRVVFVLVSIATATLYFVKQILHLLEGTKGLSQRNFKVLKEAIEGIDLIPADNEELKLLSLNKIGKKIRIRGRKIVRGIYSTIYEEPLLGYAQLPLTKYRRLTIIKTSEEDFIYDEFKDKTVIYQNGTNLGSLTRNGILFSPSNEKLGQIDWITGSNTHSIEMKDQEKAEVINPSRVEGVNIRFFKAVPPSDGKYKNEMLALSFYYLVLRNKG